MTDRISCPYCDQSFDLDQVDNADLWRMRAKIAARLGDCWALANEYVDVFRKKPDGRISLKARIRHLDGIARLWESGVFLFDGKRYRVEPRVIREAMTAVCDAGKYGFKDHNYLKAILIKSAVRISAEGLTAAEERDIDKKRQGELFKRKDEGGRMKDEEEKTMTPEEFRLKLGVLADSIGRKAGGL